MLTIQTILLLANAILLLLVAREINTVRFLTREVIQNLKPIQDECRYQEDNYCMHPSNWDHRTKEHKKLSPDLCRECNKEKESVSPAMGGCWYCHKQDDVMVFSGEFDTYLHIKCLKAALRANPQDQEAQIMASELLSEEEQDG